MSHSPSISLTLVTTNPHPHACHHHESGNENPDYDTLHMFLEAHFGEVSKPTSSVPDGSEDDLLVMRVTVDEVVATVDLISMVGTEPVNTC